MLAALIKREACSWPHLGGYCTAKNPWGTLILMRTRGAASCGPVAIENGGKREEAMSSA